MLKNTIFFGDLTASEVITVMLDDTKVQSRDEVLR